jgi:hypothetical protein
MDTIFIEILSSMLEKPSEKRLRHLLSLKYFFKCCHKHSVDVTKIDFQVDFLCLKSLRMTFYKKLKNVCPHEY